MGYKAEALQDGLTFFTPCFVDVGATTDGADLTKLTPGGNYGSGDITVSKLDFAGRNVNDYIYSKDRNDNWAWREDGVAIDEGEVFFEPGHGFSIDSYNDRTITFSGAVSTSDRMVTLQDGLTFTGNMTANMIDITEIIPGGNYSSGDITISKLDYAGRNVNDYIFSQDRNGIWAWREDGVALVEGDITFKPGEGFSVDSYNDITITIPGPTL